ncbi:MAG: hypothetical protein IJD91_00030 [Clostridia bacterium]|nr:hypothetical protein [Clostridia bacterium]
MKEQIIKKITDTVTVIDTSKIDYTSITQYAHLVENNIWTKAIQTALEEKKNVYIPDMGEEILIDNSIFMDSDTNLKIDENQVIRLVPGKNICMIRNRNIIPGGHKYVEREDPDRHISVSGGIWSAEGNKWMRCDRFQSIVGGFSHFAFSNIEELNITNVKFVKGGRAYAVMISNCYNFYVDNITFENHAGDGVHIDGPSSYGIISNLSGSGLLDDMVAILAWDWYGSGMTHGDIEYIYVHDVEGLDNEIRLLTGRKEYPNLLTHDCDIRNCVLENITGIYTYKMYYQPNCRNAYLKWDKFDSALTVGRMENIYFENISLPKLKNAGFNAIPVYGVFDILADCKNINLKNIAVSDSYETLESKDIKLVNAGPISATAQRGEGPEDWRDYFEPDMCCTVEDITIENVTMAGEKITDADKLVKETHQKINPDYPNTLPAGGTGWGKINKITVI